MRSLKIFFVCAFLLLGIAAPIDLSNSSPSVKGAALSLSEEEWRLVGQQEVPVGTVYSFEQIHEGLPVFGSMRKITADRDGNVLSDFGAAVPVEDAPALIDPCDLLSGSACAEEGFFSLGDRAIRCFCIRDGSGAHYYSAQDGALLRSLSSAPVVRSVEQKDALGNPVSVQTEYQSNGAFQRGTYTLADYTRNIHMYDARGASDASGILFANQTGVFDPMAVSVYRNVISVYDYFATARNIGISYQGITGKNDDLSSNSATRGEAVIRVLVHFGEDYENANCGYDPASNIAMMFVGDGKEDGVLYRPGISLDIIAHEYTHAITAYLVGDGGLVYLNESGAISEGLSDIFGALAEGYDLTDDRFWLIGEDSTVSAAALRSIKSPEDFDCADSVANMRPLCASQHDHTAPNSDCDAGSSHANSTIISHLMYRLYSALPEYFTKECLGTLFFTAQCKLTPYADFEMFTQALRASAKELSFGEEALRAVDGALIDSGLLKIHTVTFYDAEGNVLSEQKVEHGMSATPPTTPLKASDAHCDYEFAGWDHELDRVKSDLEVHPLYHEFRCYTVTYLCDDRVLKTERVRAGGSVAPPPAPEKPFSAEYEYSFEGWDGEAREVQSDLFIHAKFNRKVREYLVRFHSAGEVLITQAFPYGTQFVFSLPPSREGYTFGGWYLDEGCQIPADGAIVVKETDVYCKWIKNSGCGATAPALACFPLLLTPILFRKRK